MGVPPRVQYTYIITCWQSKCMNSNCKHELVCQCASTKNSRALQTMFGRKQMRQRLDAFWQTSDVVRSAQAVNRAQEVTAPHLKVYISARSALQEQARIWLTCKNWMLKSRSVKDQLHPSFFHNACLRKADDDPWLIVSAPWSPGY